MIFLWNATIKSIQCWPQLLVRQKHIFVGFDSFCYFFLFSYFIFIPKPVSEHLPFIINMTFTGELERSPQAKNFNVSVDNQSVPIVAVSLDSNGRLIIEL